MELSLYAKVCFLNHTNNFIIIKMFHVYCCDLVAIIDEPMPGAVRVEFVNKTPRIIGRDVLVEFETMGTTDTVLCELGDYAVVEDCKYIITQHTQA